MRRIFAVIVFAAIVVSTVPALSASFNDVYQRAQSGEVQAQAALAAMYYQGNNVKQNYSEAFKWFRKAAEQGNAAAQYNLGKTYYQDEEFMNLDEAFKWLYKAAVNGVAAAQNNLGTMYLAGDVKGKPLPEHGENGLFPKAVRIKQDYAEGVKWLRKAARQNKDLESRNIARDNLRRLGEKW